MSNHTDRLVVARAAHRRAAFMRSEVNSGRVPQSHALGQAYLQEADYLLELYPAWLYPELEAEQETVADFARWLEDVTPADFSQ